MSASGPLFCPVGLTNSLEQRFGWLAFPGLIRGIFSIHFFMLILLIFRPEAVEVFRFDWAKILAGESWRLVSFLAIPQIGVGASPTLAVLIMFIVMMIGYLINDSLEHAWGVFRTSVYVYAVLACQVLAAILFQITLEGVAAATLYQSLFLAFATVFPRYEFRLYFILPVQVWILAALDGAFILFASVESLPTATYYLLCYLPYLAWALPHFLKWGRVRSKAAVRQASFKSKMKAATGGAAFHKCERCGATDQSHPDREFRVTPDEHEFCDACLEAEPDDSEALESTS